MLFAVFSFGFDTDPDTCVVSNKDDLIAVRIPYVDSDMTINTDQENPQDKIDVAVRFKFFFDACFLLSCGQFVIGILHLLFNKQLGVCLGSLIKFLFWLANILITILWFFVFTVRYMHSGSECSGDLIVSKKEAKYLMYVEGMFIKLCSLFMCFIILLFMMGHLLNYCQRKTGGSTCEIELEI